MKNKQDVIEKAQKEGKTVHFATLMDLSNLKNSGLDKKFEKIKARVVLRGDVVRDDSRSYVVFTVQGSSASHMTAVRVLDVISRLPRCTGQACDAVSAHAQMQMEDAPKLLGLPDSACLTIWICLERNSRTCGTN